MDVALLFLPLIGGFIFSKVWIATKFACAREDGHRLYFRAGFYAMFLFAFALLVRLLLTSQSQTYRDIELLLGQIVMPFMKTEEHTYQVPLSLVCIYAMLLSLPLAAVLTPVAAFLNRVRGKSSFLEQALDDSPVEALLQRSVVKESPVAITMDNRKVYIGYVVATADPEKERKAIRLLPIASGYRDKDTLDLVLTTSYDPLYEEEKPGEGLEDAESAAHDEAAERGPSKASYNSNEDRILILPASRVHSLNMFDFVAFEKFQSRQALVDSASDSKIPNDDEEVNSSDAEKEPT